VPHAGDWPSFTMVTNVKCEDKTVSQSIYLCNYDQQITKLQQNENQQATHSPKQTKKKALGYILHLKGSGSANIKILESQPESIPLQCMSGSGKDFAP